MNLDPPPPRGASSWSPKPPLTRLDHEGIYVELGFEHQKDENVQHVQLHSAQLSPALR